MLAKCSQEYWKSRAPRLIIMLWYVELWRRVGCTYHSLGALRFPSEVDVQDCTSGLKKWTLGDATLLSCLSGMQDLPLSPKVSQLWYVKGMVRKTAILGAPGSAAAALPQVLPTGQRAPLLYEEPKDQNVSNKTEIP